MIYHVWNKFTPKDPDTLRRNTIAQMTWANQRWAECPVCDDDLPRLWREEGRQYAYIKDVFDHGCRCAYGPRDIICYTNADIHVRDDCCVQIGIVLMNSEACYGFRRDFGKLTSPLAFDMYAKGHRYCGSDLFAFRVEWWQTYRTEMPDLLNGHEAWDCCLRHVIESTNPDTHVEVHNVIGHERHDSRWEKKENRTRLRGQIYCRQIAARWLRAHGVKPAMHGL